MVDIISVEAKQSTEQSGLTPDEKLILKKIRNKRLFYIISCYLTLAGVLINAWGKDWLDIILLRDLEIHKFGRIAPYFMLFLFLLLTGFFINYYLRSVSPLIKDLKANKKNVVSFVPGKYQTPFFAEYYLMTPFKKNPLIRIDEPVYNSIHDNSTGVINITLFAKFVFSVQIDDKIIKFNYSVISGDI